MLVRERGSDGEILMLGRQYENATVCGRPATMRARKLNPKTMRFESSETRALSQGERNTAERVFAKRLDRKISLDRPRLLHASVASSAVGRNRGGMTDRNLDTVWAENRPGTGSGEFIVMSSSEDVPILGFELALRPHRGRTSPGRLSSLRRGLPPPGLPPPGWLRVSCSWSRASRPFAWCCPRTHGCKRQAPHTR